MEIIYSKRNILNRCYDQIKLKFHYVLKLGFKWHLTTEKMVEKGLKLFEIWACQAQIIDLSITDPTNI